jgi:hypothetical protein
MYTTEREMEDFIKEYMSSRVVIESSVRAAINTMVAQERRLKKSFDEFTKEEILSIYKSLGSISAVSLQNRNLTLCHFVNFQNYTKGKNVTNQYKTITKEDIKTCLDTNKKSKMIITREQLMEIENQLLNYTDKAIINLLFLGIGCEDWASELTFLQTKQISKADMRVYFNNGKVVDIDQNCYNILMKSAEEDELMSYSGTRVSKVVPQGVIFKIRFNSLNANDNIKDQGDKERRFRWLQRRIKIINDYLNLHITPSSLCDSGLLSEIQRGITLNGLPFRQYIVTEECKILAQRYGLYSSHYAVILVEKFKGYFEE